MDVGSHVRSLKATASQAIGCRDFQLRIFKMRLPTASPKFARTIFLPKALVFKILLSKFIVPVTRIKPASFLQNSANRRMSVAFINDFSSNKRKDIGKE
jgi:hypothetical protein